MGTESTATIYDLVDLVDSRGEHPAEVMVKHAVTTQHLHRSPRPHHHRHPPSPPGPRDAINQITSFSDWRLKQDMFYICHAMPCTYLASGTHLRCFVILKHMKTRGVPFSKLIL